VTRRELGRLMTGALTTAAVIPTATGRSVGIPGLGAKTSRRCSIPRRGIGTYTSTAPRPTAVINALREFYERYNANPGKTQHAMGTAGL
jgi:hypothetical protein